MNIEYVGFTGMGFQGKISVKCVYFPLYVLCSFIENLFAVKYCTRLKSTFGIRDLLDSGGRLCGQRIGSGL
jgi:hypothetical protein